jgi:hypothetical protein
MPANDPEFSVKFLIETPRLKRTKLQGAPFILQGLQLPILSTSLQSLRQPLPRFFDPAQGAANAAEAAPVLPSPEQSLSSK